MHGPVPEGAPVNSTVSVRPSGLSRAALTNEGLLTGGPAGEKIRRGNGQHRRRVLDTPEPEQPRWQPPGTATGLEDPGADAHGGDCEPDGRRRPLPCGGLKYPQRLAGADQRGAVGYGRARRQRGWDVDGSFEVCQLGRAIGETMQRISNPLPDEHQRPG